MAFVKTNILPILVSLLLASVFGWFFRYLAQEALIVHYVEYCADQFRPRFRERGYKECVENAEAWRYGDAPKNDWESWEAQMREHEEWLEENPPRDFEEELEACQKTVDEGCTPADVVAIEGDDFSPSLSCADMHEALSTASDEWLSCRKECPVK